MVALFIVIVLAALAYWLCIVIGLPFVVAVIAAVLVLLAGADHLTGGRYRRF